jgi:tRNA(His) 5'-end guanylyltransferase
MKLFEQSESGRRLMPTLPVCIRIDGKNFSSLTKPLRKPFDERLSNVLIQVTKWLVGETGARCGYTQSDEISLILYSDDVEHQVFFDAKVQKLTSVVASMATAKFNDLVRGGVSFKDGDLISSMDQCIPEIADKLACFDARVWNVPTLVEAANCIVWREIDATRNSISSAAQAHFSHKSLQGKNSSQMQDMLFEKGINWNDYPSAFKRGTYVVRRVVERTLTEQEMAKIPVGRRPDGPITRNENVIVNLPPITKVENKVECLIFGQEPMEYWDEQDDQVARIPEADQEADQ